MAGDGSLTVTVVRTPAGTEVLLAGDLDLATAHRLSEAVTDACGILASEQEPRPVVLDLRGVTSCDVTGLRGLARARGRIRARGAACTIVSSPAVDRAAASAGRVHRRRSPPDG